MNYSIGGGRPRPREHPLGRRWRRVLGALPRPPRREAFSPPHFRGRPPFSVLFRGLSSTGHPKSLGVNVRRPILRFGQKEQAPPDWPVAVYNYQDENGTLLFQVLRYWDQQKGKTFKQRRPGPDGTWVWNLKGVRRVLYRLPEVLTAVREGRPVFIVEGEKDADSLAALGLVATTNPNGAGKWRPEYSEALHGARVVILPDNTGEEACRRNGAGLLWRLLPAECWVFWRPACFRPRAGPIT